MRGIIPGAEPFFFAGNRTGCLLIHGFTGTPNELRELGTFLAENGFTVSGILLAGHGTNLQEMEKTTWHNWHRSAVEGYQELQSRCDEVFALGLSMGGLLALHLGAHYPLKGIVAMSTPAFIRDWRLPFLLAFKHFIRFLGKGPSDFRDRSVEATHIDYDRYPTRSIEQLLRLLAHVRDDLPEVRAPVLFIHSRNDKSVPPENISYLYEHISSRDKEVVWVENSGHVITEDLEKDKVFRACLEFIKRHTKCPVERVP